MGILPDKSLMLMNKRDRFTDPRFRQALVTFLDYAESNPKRGKDGLIFCPCKKCGNRHLFKREVIEEHMLVNGFEPLYKFWIFHGEGVPDEMENRKTQNIPLEVESPSRDRADETREMLEDIILGEDIGHDDSIEGAEGIDELQKLMEKKDQDLYLGCTEFSKLSFLIRIFYIKTVSGMAGKHFDMLLDLLRKVIPEGKENILKNHYEAKKIIKTLGFNYEKIDACPNDCILFRKDYKSLDEYPICGLSRWKKDKRTSVVQATEGNLKKNKIPAKILRYFPLTRRLQRLYITKGMAESMRWHFKCRVKDGKLRHPADTEAWSHLDSIDNFGDEFRNIRLGLATDGFNPYGNMSSTWSTWPVLLMPYNLPPTMCMKQPYTILSLLIPGRYSPGQNIDIYLEPLIEELEELWKYGVVTYDAFTDKKFKMRVAIIWTINDFSAYGMLSGWSVYAEHACPLCGYNYSGEKLQSRGKYCYWCHRRWLPVNHPFRKLAIKFDGTHEVRLAPKQLTGKEIFEHVSLLQTQYGCNRFNIDGSLNKASKRKRATEKPDEKGWKKKSIFFNLPYWKHLKIRHNIDVMHVEKNVCDNIISTLLHNQSKSKDNLSARNDLREFGIRPELHPIPLENNVYEIPASSHTMTKEAMKNFCEVLKNVKTSDGYSSNISKNVQVQERKILNLKTHDYHILLHQLILVALRHNLPSSVTKPLIEFCGFFNQLCSKVIDVVEFKRLEKSIVETLCKLEMIFPPYFFTVIIHLSVHLATEARIAGPVSFRWMYPVERYVGYLKRQLRNRARPEGSIAESYIANECINFASRYLRGVETRLNSPSRVIDGHLSCPQGEDRAYKRDWLEQAHLYIINNLQIIDEYKRIHLEELKNEIRGRDALWKIEQEHRKHFSQWFRKYIEDGISKGMKYDDDIVLISKGLASTVKRYTSYSINNVKFHTTEREGNRVTQNNGVCCPFEQNFYSSSRDQRLVEGNKPYYGQLEDVLEFFYGYQEHLSFIMFKVHWCAWPLAGKDEHGFQLVNLKKEIHQDDKFMLASQAEQCFYVKVGDRDDVWVALKKPQISLVDSPDEESDEDNGSENEVAFTSSESEPNFCYVFPIDNDKFNTSASTSK